MRAQATACGCPLATCVPQATAPCPEAADAATHASGIALHAPAWIGGTAGSGAQAADWAAHPAAPAAGSMACAAAPAIGEVRSEGGGCAKARWWAKVQGSSMVFCFMEIGMLPYPLHLRLKSARANDNAVTDTGLIVRTGVLTWSNAPTNSKCHEADR